MAETTVTTNGRGGKADWQVDRREMAAEVREHILDPLALVAGILTQIDPNTNYYPELKDVGRLLKLMVEGAHIELGLYCSSVGGPVSHPFTFNVSQAKEGME